MTYPEDQYLGRHRELKDGGMLRDLVSGDCYVEEPSVIAIDGAVNDRPVGKSQEKV
jgi:hypothetical protein